MMRLCWLAMALVLSGPVQAQQLKHDIEKGGGQWRFTVVWKDAEGQRNKAKFTLPAEGIKEDLEEPVYVGLEKMSKVAVRDINQHDFGKGVRCEASAKGLAIKWNCTANKPEKRERAMKECQEIYDDRAEIWMKRHGMKELENGRIGIDWGRHVQDYARPLAPVVEGLGGATADPRDFASKALGFVQTIPYETRGKKPDKFRRPLSILGRNRGDCDSKTVLFLALMHQAYPELGLGVIAIRKHAFGALALAPEPGETSVRIDGEKWVAVEPVGPAQNEIGSVGRHSRRALRLRRYKVIDAN